MIPVKVEQLFISNMGFVVLLRGIEDERVLQIFIGAAEAQAIAIHLNGVSIPRPLTHDLLKNILEYLECRVKRVEVCDVRDGTFFAKLVIERAGTELEIDSRPSDAIAVALRCVAPVFVAEKVMDEAGRILEKQDPAAAPGGEKGEKKEGKPAVKEMSTVAKLQQDLEKAVGEERYEDAARIRDDIKRLESLH